MKKKKIAVMFTGGLDSTYLLYKNLRDGHIVTPIYITIENNVDKTEKEKVVRDAILTSLKDDFKFTNLDTLTELMSVRVSGRTDCYDLPQMPVWAFATSWLDGKSFDEIHIGYVMNDCAVSYVEDIKRVYKSFELLQNRKLTDHKTILKFPLAKTSKYEIMESMPDGLASKVWACETPNRKYVGPKVTLSLASEYPEIKDTKSDYEYTPCGECQSCKRYDAISKDGEWVIKKFPTIYSYKNADFKERLYRLRSDVSNLGFSSDLPKTLEMKDINNIIGQMDEVIRKITEVNGEANKICSDSGLSKLSELQSVERDVDEGDAVVSSS